MANVTNFQVRDPSCMDKWIWHHNSKRVWTVKSAYHVQKEGHQINSASTASTSFRISDSTWKKLWSLPFKPNVRNFLWWTLYGNLAMGENLVKRRVQIENIWHMYGETNESIEHIFSQLAISLELFGSDPLYHSPLMLFFLVEKVDKPILRWLYFSRAYNPYEFCAVEDMVS